METFLRERNSVAKGAEVRRKTAGVEAGWTEEGTKQALGIRRDVQPHGF